MFRGLSVTNALFISGKNVGKISQKNSRKEYRRIFFCGIALKFFTQSTHIRLNLIICYLLYTDLALYSLLLPRESKFNEPWNTFFAIDNIVSYLRYHAHFCQFAKRNFNKLEGKQKRMQRQDFYLVPFNYKIDTLESMTIGNLYFHNNT